MIDLSKPSCPVYISDEGELKMRGKSLDKFLSSLSKTPPSKDDSEEEE
jgi:hypothetical protein